MICLRGSEAEADAPEIQPHPTLPRPQARGGSNPPLAGGRGPRTRRVGAGAGRDMQPPSSPRPQKDKPVLLFTILRVPQHPCRDFLAKLSCYGRA
jgi:hypothetical protein